MKVILLALPTLLLAVPAWVQTALPVPNLGSCPPAYAQSSDYCVDARRIEARPVSERMGVLGALRHADAAVR
jgi:hypothetical protein